MGFGSGASVYDKQSVVMYDPGIGPNFQYWMKTTTSDTKTDSGVAVDADWHTFRIRQTVIGTMLFSIDGAETTINHLQDSTLGTGFYLWLDGSGASGGQPTRNIAIDYLTITTTNLNR